MATKKRSANRSQIPIQPEVHGELKDWCVSNGITITDATERLWMWFLRGNMPAQFMVLYGLRPIPASLRVIAAREILMTMLAEAEEAVRAERSLEREQPRLLAELQRALAAAGAQPTRPTTPAR